MSHRLSNRIVQDARPIIAALIAALLLVGCGGGATMMYAGPRKPPSEVVLLTTEVRVKLLKVDGKKVSSSKLELLPGEHRVDVKVTFLGEEINDTFKDMRRSCTANAKFIAEPGIEYRIAKISESGKVRENVTTLMFGHEFGLEVRDVTNDESIPDAMSPMKCG